ncbi:HpcH/HpaI aldolase/citrate lyase family protein [Homoserinibacter sp. GY 40078]|uniref:HpcH/HpaI aldolase family protein n=1 Tax=Homoserinibacter sp. GY 40078 TaxID=2603275 RepID=UPI0011CCC55C|nr:aldolase/citrate lyase family protein [Homoserinibacter sp. GY 40078]TXK19848.1 aldolase [Homoserinibacter sp. GY 40078]
MAVSLGAWSMLNSAPVASLLAGTNADWTVLDAQHGLFDDRGMVESLALAGAAHPNHPMHVRVAANEPWLIGRALDAGAAGVIVPMVDDEAQAAAAAGACCYPPRGTRSWGPMGAAYGAGAAASPTEVDARIQCAVMVETRTGLGNVDAIAATAGVDMIFLGPFDLSIALGIELPELLGDRSAGNPLDTVVAACREHGIRAGAFAGSAATATALAERGFTHLALAVDTFLIASATTQLVDEVRRSLDG